MRTTISIDDGLLAALKAEAHRRGGTVSQVIGDAVRRELSSLQRRQGPVTFRLVTFRGDGPRSGVDLDRPSELLDHEDLETYRRKL